MSSTDERTLVSEIEKAFSHRSLPGFISDHCSGIESELDAFLGKNLDWRATDGDFWELNYNALSFFSPEALCYYLPGILISSVLEREPNLIAVVFVISMLDRGSDISLWEDLFLRRWSLLTVEECQALQDWIIWLSDFEDFSLPISYLERSLDVVEMLKKI